MVFPTSIVLPYSTLMALCDRSGCSEPVFLQYGFDPIAAVVWLEVPPDADASGLCEIHAERLTAPKGWTIDDRRDPSLRLFRPGPSNRSAIPARKRRAARKRNTVQEEIFESTIASESHAETSSQTSRDPSTASSLLNDAEETAPPLTPLLSRAFRGTRLESD